MRDVNKVQSPLPFENPGCMLCEADLTSKVCIPCVQTGDMVIVQDGEEITADVLNHCNFGKGGLVQPVQSSAY